MQNSTIALIGAVIFFIFLIRGLSRRSPELNGIDNKIKFLTTEATDIASKSHGIQLDFSIASIQKVENEILSKLHDEYLRTQDENGLRGLAMAYGAYIGECIRQSEKDARWEEDHPLMGEKTFPIHWKGGESFPMQWCYKRIISGPEENVWAKYNALKQMRDEQQTQ